MDNFSLNEEMRPRSFGCQLLNLIPRYSKGWQKNKFEEQQTEFIETYTFMFRKVIELVLDQKSYLLDEVKVVLLTIPDLAKASNKFPIRSVIRNWDSWPSDTYVFGKLHKTMVG